MKKSFLTLAMAILVGLFALNINADAQGKGYGNKGENKGTNFVDEDGDGVCDYFTDEDGDGVCDHCAGDGTGTGNKGENKGNSDNGQRKRNFEDMDGDGVCDNAQETVMNASVEMFAFLDEDGDGVCDNAGQGRGTGEFTDEDGDGQCDNYSERGNRGQGGNRQRDFTDEDGDGQCDNYATRPLVNFPYPNPFTESTELSFTLPADGYVTAAVYDYDGNQIEVIVDGDLTAGDYSFTFIPENLETGRYLFTVQFGEFIISKPMVFVQ